MGALRTSLRFAVLLTTGWGGVYAQTILSRSSDAISYTRARISFLTDVTSTNDTYCVSSVSATPPFSQCTMLNTAPAGLNHSKIVGRLTPNTTYHWYVCTNNGLVCSDGSDTFTTLPEPSPRFALPTKPTMVTPLTDPGVYGGSYTMATCTQADFQAGLNAAGAYAGSLAYLVLIPWSSNEVCNGINGKLPARACEPTCGPVVVKPAVPSDLYLPPPGVRLHPDQAFWYANAVTLSSNVSGAGNCTTTCPSVIYANQNTSNWLFIGLKLTRSNATTDPASAIVNFRNNGGAFNIHDVTFDRCAFLYPPTLPPSPSSIRGITATLTNLSVINCYAYMIDYTTGGAAQFAIVFEISGLQGGRFENNDIMGIGISVFAQSGAPPSAATRTMNIYFHRNHWWWDRAWALDGTANTYSRQMLEFKQGWYIWQDGDAFEDEWYGGQTGVYGNIITITLRANDSLAESNGSINEMSNIMFTNITARRIPGFVVLSAEEGAGSTARIIDALGSQDWWFENILVYGINGNDCHRLSACAARGQLAMFGGAFQNITFDHVTSMAPQQGFGGPYNFPWLDQRGSGLRIRNNILSANWDAVGYGTGGGFYANASSTPSPALPAASLPNSSARFNYFLTNEDGLDPTLSIGPNIVFQGSTDTNNAGSYTNPANLYDKATCTALYQQDGKNTCVGVGTTPAQSLYNQNSTFTVNAQNNNYEWLYNSPYVGTASDGLSYGADLYKLSVAQGLVITGSLQATSAGKLYWETRDPATVCYVDAGGVRTTVAGGPRFKNVTLAGGPGTAFTLACAGAMDSTTYKPAVYSGVIPGH